MATILAIDDLAGIRQTNKVALEAAGHAVLQAVDGSAGATGCILRPKQLASNVARLSRP